MDGSGPKRVFASLIVGFPNKDESAGDEKKGDQKDWLTEKSFLQSY